jgi:hypothetical protein
MFCCPLAAFFIEHGPLLWVTAISFVAGVLMLVVFRYTSDQKKIRRAKDHVQAQLLAVRLFQDQLPAVLRAYGRLLRGTVRYIGLMLKPTVLLVLVFAPLIVLLDPYFGWQALRPKQDFLVKVRAPDPKTLDSVSLQLPNGIKSSAPPVHVPFDQQVVWRLTADADGVYLVTIVANGVEFSKSVIVSTGLSRISATSMRGHFWQRWMEPGAVALPDDSPLYSIAVAYSPRELNLWHFEANWIIVFFAISIVAALLFKKALHVEI